MSLHLQLLQNPSLTFDCHIFYQKDLDRSTLFEKDYLEIREKENRIYNDAVVQTLPTISPAHPLANEWKARKASLKKLIEIIRVKNHRTILELGCGNGWLSHNLATLLKAEICGIDINETELLQAAKLFSQFKNLSFLYADVFSMNLQEEMFDAIILGSSIQYFDSIEILLTRLSELLSPRGSIYIIDSSFYNNAKEAELAKERSFTHFTNLGVPSLISRYHHHTFASLSGFKPSILFDPKTLLNRVKRKLLKVNLPLFPIITISKKA